MTKLNQLLAVEKDVKSRTYRELTDAHQLLQKPQPLTGIARTYTPKDDEGEQLPPESTRVQIKTEDLVDEVFSSLTRLFDVTATKDYTNTTAKADVKVGTQTLITGAPVPFLLFLEKQMHDLRTFFTKLPTLDPAEEWEFNLQANTWATKPVETTRTKKVLRNHVAYEATAQHPAQVQTYSEDVIVGTWKTIKFSGAMPGDRVHELLERLTVLEEAVKYAREQANSVAVDDQKVGATIFGYLLNG